MTVVPRPTFATEVLSRALASARQQALEAAASIEALAPFEPWSPAVMSVAGELAGILQQDSLLEAAMAANAVGATAKHKLKVVQDPGKAWQWLNATGRQILLQQAAAISTVVLAPAAAREEQGVKLLLRQDEVLAQAAGWLGVMLTWIYEHPDTTLGAGLDLEALRAFVATHRVVR